MLRNDGRHVSSSQIAGELGIRVIIDMVLNHTSDQHAWFQEALKDPNSEYRDYYMFVQSKERPSNTRSCFGGSVWEKAGEAKNFEKNSTTS